MLLRHQRSPPIIRKMIYPSDAPLPLPPARAQHVISLGRQTSTLGAQSFSLTSTHIIWTMLAPPKAPIGPHSYPNPPRPENPLTHETTMTSPPPHPPPGLNRGPTRPRPPRGPTPGQVPSRTRHLRYALRPRPRIRTSSEPHQYQYQYQYRHRHHPWSRLCVGGPWNHHPLPWRPGGRPQSRATDLNPLPSFLECFARTLRDRGQRSPRPRRRPGELSTAAAGLHPRRGPPGSMPRLLDKPTPGPPLCRRRDRQRLHRTCHHDHDRDLDCGGTRS